MTRHAPPRPVSTPRGPSPTWTEEDEAIDSSSGARVMIPPSLRQEDQLGRYELLVPLARGGMSAVWVARLRHDNGFQKVFAIKTLLTHLAEDDQFRDMLIDEARIVARIEHPNVGQIFDVNEDGESIYVVMEWIEGVSLFALTRLAEAGGIAIPMGVILRVIVDACAGLDAVHELTDWEGRPLDVVHRDVSPHNLVIGMRGITKVIDFGIAHARNRIGTATARGVLKGKIRYMAPEQARGQAVDRRADIWGLGAVLHKALTGTFPYPGETDVDTLRAMAKGAAPEIPASIPSPLRAVLRRALSVKPGDRYATAAEMGDAIEAAASQMGVSIDQRHVAKAIGHIAGADVAVFRATIRDAMDDRDAPRNGRERARSHAMRENALTVPSFDPPVGALDDRTDTDIDGEAANDVEAALDIDRAISDALARPAWSDVDVDLDAAITQDLASIAKVAVVHDATPALAGLAESSPRVVPTHRPPKGSSTSLARVLWIVGTVALLATIAIGALVLALAPETLGALHSTPIEAAHAVPAVPSAKPSVEVQPSPLVPMRP